MSSQSLINKLRKYWLEQEEAHSDRGELYEMYLAGIFDAVRLLEKWEAEEIERMEKYYDNESL